MSDINQQIEAIKKEIRETPYHKATERHVGLLRARLAKLKDRLIEGSVKKKSGGGGGYAIKKQGDATVILIGPPSAGKSTLINRLTNAESKVAPYAFTTVSVVPGMLKYKDAYIQILDVPGLIEGAEEGKGRGREVLSVARSAELIIVITDVARPQAIDRIVSSLEENGIRLNQKPPEVRIVKKLSGGLVVRSNVKSGIDKNAVKEIAREFGLTNAEITIKEPLDTGRLIDAFVRSRVYLPALLVVNKIDRGSVQSNKVIKISAEKGIGIDKLIDKIWDSLNLRRVFLVKKDEEPNFESPIIMKAGSTLKAVAEKIGTEFVEDKKKAKIWGAGAKFPGQTVSLSIPVAEGMQIRFIS